MGKRILTVAALGLAAFISRPASGMPLSPQTTESKPGQPSQQAAKVQEIARLVETRQPDALARIGEALSDESWYVRGEAARALGRLGDRAAVSILLPLIQDSNWYVRESSLQALSEIGDPGAGAALLPLLEN
ncbi:MAG TPA: HEAT repeat domain-containing protein, partial [Blastocatellia bacterium]|nr:HEAT repeat domain-containing protein [Blastocatellia bacterium]